MRSALHQLGRFPRDPKPRHNGVCIWTETPRIHQLENTTSLHEGRRWVPARQPVLEKLGQPSIVAASQREEQRKPMSARDKPMKREKYETELRTLQVELCALQDWIKDQGLRVVVVFEGRDAAGKGGTIKAITDRVSPRVFRVVALPAPSDRDRTQLYMQRYLRHFPAAGEIVIFDRSWYNRAGVEYVMDFCSKVQHKRFLQVCPEFERYVIDDGIQ